MNDLVAIILAAGKGERIGQPKWQLTYQGKTFLDIIVAKLHAAALFDCACVVRSESIPENSLCQNIINPDPDNGMISSIFYGVQNAALAAGYLIFPVDHPHIQATTLLALREAFATHPEMVIQPCFQGEVGHPIIIPQSIATLIPQLDYAGGLKQLLIDNQVVTKYVPVDDHGVLTNINLPSDLSIDV